MTALIFDCLLIELIL